MKNLRRGHHTQGKLKRVNIMQGYESYESYMAPMRVEALRRARPDKYKSIPKPNVETFLTPGWEEMVPYPTTWKVKFDGYGATDPTYFQEFCKYQQEPHKLPYAPNLISHVGGSFATTVCVCNTPGRECKCAEKDGQRAELDKVEADLEILKKEMGTKHAGCGW